MKKEVERPIFNFQEDLFFTPIRNKLHYAKVVCLGARILLINEKSFGTESLSRMRLLVDKMSRLFFYQDKKFFSISFPFWVSIEGDEVNEIKSYGGRKLDNRSISSIISILEHSHFTVSKSLIDYYIDPGDIEEDSVALLEEILQFEPSYIRYDHDVENANGKMHPLHHFDINYSQYGTFKVGLKEAITQKDFEDIQNINTDCFFINR